MSVLDSFFNKGAFKAAKCKTLLKLTIPRIKLLRNRREIQIKQMRRDIAKLLETGQEATARIRVEHIIREENMMAAQEIIELFCELIVVRLPIIETQRECPLDLKEAISSACFAAPRCADLPELQQVQMLFASKYGKEFVAAASELMPDCGVNRQLIELLSIRAPPAHIKLKLLKEIAEEHELDWDPSASETEFLKPHEDLLNGPTQFISGSKLPLPKEKHQISPPSSPVQDPHEQSDSDTGFGQLGFTEVPKVPLQPTVSTESAPRMVTPHLPDSPDSGADDELRKHSGVDDEVKKYSGGENEVKKYSGADDEVEKYSGAENEVKKYSGAGDEVKKYSGAENEVKKYSGAHDEVKKYSGAEDELRKYSGADDEVKKQSGADDDLRKYSGADDELKKYSGVDDELRNYSGAYDELKKYSEADDDLGKYSGADDDLGKYSGFDGEQRKYSEQRNYSGGDELRKFSGADEDVGKYSGADDELRRYSGPYDEQRKYSGADEEMRKYSGADDELGKYSGGVDELRKYSIPNENLARQAHWESREVVTEPPNASPYESENISVSTGEEDKQFLPFISPPSLSGASFSANQSKPAPSIFSTKSEANIDLQDVLAAAHTAADSAERAAAAARSAATLAQVRITELIKKRDGPASEDALNTFHKDSTDLGSNRRSATYDTLKIGDDAQISDDQVVEHGSTHNPLQRLTSMEDDPYFSYPNLFSRQNSNVASDVHSSAEISPSTRGH